jgi:two-component system nitrogen regulation sensor histidine kinase GlnL
MADDPDCVVLTIQEQSISRIIDRQMTYRSAARSVSAMSSVMAHEIKNPLSGIRGAAQLLETGVDDENKALTRLICEETDRIVNLIDRMDIFADSSPTQYEAVNLHEVLGHVRKLAENGFAKHVRFIENYDPSLPKTLGDRDRLIQAFLNLVKNAAEAVPRENGEIQLSTAYRHGVRLAMPGRTARVHLPLVVTVQDNGEGIPPDIQSHLFDPFVTSKRTGTGLGLAVVAKVVNDHGGVVEFESGPRRTAFRIMLPMYRETDEAKGEGT